MHIQKIMLRYYIPFSFICNNERQYNKICDCCREIFGEPANAITAENDFFANVSDLYNSNISSSIGTFFKASKITLPHLFSEDKKYNLEIKKAGLYLNKNGIGIFWYEVQPCKVITDDSNLLLIFQHSFKELARHESPFSWREYISQKIELDYIHNKSEILTSPEKITDFLRRNGYNYDVSLIEKIVLKKNQKSIMILSKLSDFHMGIWIRDILAFVGEHHYMPERFTGNNQMNIPDKAILCSCTAYHSESENDDLNFIFAMTKGYTTSYQRTNEFKNTLYVPFNNICWSASYEGIGQYINLTNTANSSFFNDLAFKRMENYCYLFVLILQQYYSLLYYSKKIALISDGKSKLKKASYIKMLELTDELNEFFLRNTFPQVSHISHQNEVYEYIRNIYKINDFYEQVNNGLQAVAEKAKSYRSEKHDDLIKIFSIIGAFWGISEVICNTSDIIVFVLGKKQADTEWLMILIYVLLLTALSGFLVWLIWYISKRKK